ncbi:efflux RND transporter permease subunit [Candidatus Dojkabacteria bacterium]|uniref:Efflux RND transporter permease subunit n=1 Tax=Candidatus Dojkabacteria bacterium TaxID=2099670 RepID=A0A955L897_9BACT|nr:efflux RND transporter permease subunit [Candidatus Dojkabacteria bacterium]
MKRNIAGRITEFFLYNKPLTLLVLIGIIVAGAIIYVVTPKQYNPEVILPAFQIITEYPGATAEEVENFITLELEEKIADIEGVDKITSRSIDGGASIVMVEFKVGTDLTDAKILVQSKISENLDLLQDGMSPPVIKNINPDDIPILTVGFSSETLSQNEVRTKIVTVMNELKKIDGVANLEVHGGERRALRILLDPAAMKYRNVSTSDVQDAIMASNIRMPVGDIKDGNYSKQIEVNGWLVDENEVAQISVAPGIKLGDIAQIQNAYSEKSSYVQVDRVGSESSYSTLISIAKRKGENAIVISDSIIDALDQLDEQSELDGIDYEIMRNDGTVAQEAVSGLGLNLMQSVFIVFLVLLLFLGKRSASIVALAIPLTLLMVFVVGYLADQTINRITLFALILSLGLLVDSATVVVENIYRHLKLDTKKTKKEAIVDAVNEIGIGLFLSTLTSVIVFLPTSQISGMMGEYMKPLSFFVPVALIMSLLIAYIIIPFIADWVLSVEAVESTQKKKFDISSLFDRLSDWYGGILEKLIENERLQKRFLRIVFISLMLVLSFPILRLVHFRMLPSADKNQYYVYIDAPEGTDIEKTYEITKTIRDVLLEQKYSESIISFVGTPPVIDFNGMYKGADFREAPNLATLKVSLMHMDTRNETSEEIVSKTRGEILKNETIQSYISDGTVIQFIQDPPGPPVQATFVAKIKGSNQEIRENIATQVVEYMESIDGIVDIDTSIESAYPKTIYEIDNEKAMASGISTYHIATTLRTALASTQISQFHLNGHPEISFIEMQFAKQDRDSQRDISKIYVKNQMGTMVPLESFVREVSTRNTPMRINDGREPTTYITAEVDGRSIIYAVIDLIEVIISDNYGVDEEVDNYKATWDLFGINLGSKEGDTYHLEWGGEWKMTVENFRDLGIAMLIAMILIYSVLVAQFKSFTIPRLIMTTIPLGLVGILPGFAFLDVVNGTFLTATSLIGFIALMGIVVNNAIIYLEYLTQQLELGIPLKEALVTTGKTRLRPIVLTSMTTVFSSLTIAGDPVWSGLAWSIVFGLSLSAILTLGVLPILYLKSTDTN